jgi:rfaE bifunctional protein kinase chain/domain
VKRDVIAHKGSGLPDTTRARVLVVGDVMLDRYWFGDVERVSPEAPVPIVKVDHAEERPGGASNVARNVAALGAKAALLSVIGEDEPGDRLAELVAAAGISATLHRDPTISTTVKLRVVARHQQLLRIDFETAPSREVLADKLNDYTSLLDSCDLVVLSDYGKGGLTHITQMIDLARERNRTVLVDPKGDDYSRYRGANIITPNRAELRTVVGRWTSESDLEGRVQALRKDLGIDALLLTRSEEGMSLFQQDGVRHEPASAREVFDVSGAGDTVIAAVAVMLASGASLADAMKVANVAAGIVVGKLGTATVELDELRTALVS